MNKRTLFFLITFFLFSITLKAQVNLDSLFTIWNDTSLPDTSRLEAMQTIAWDGYRYNNPDSSFYFAQLQYDLAETTGYKKWMAAALKTQGYIYRSKADFNKALDYFSRGLKIYEEIDNKSGIAESLNNIGVVQERKGDFDKALEYYLQSLETGEKIKSRENIGETLYNLGRFYFRKGDYDIALDYLKQSFEICKETGNLKGQTNAQDIIGLIYQSLGDYEEALEVYAHNLAIYKKMENKQAIAGTQANIGNIYMLQENYPKALENFKVALEAFEDIGIITAVAGIGMQIGTLYSDQGNYALAMEYYTRSLNIFEKTKDKLHIAIAKGNIATIYSEQGNFAKAISLAASALKLSEETGDLIRIMESAQKLAYCYKTTGRYKQALEMNELYYQTRDSLKSEENQKAAVQLQVQSDYEKQKAIDDLENEKRVAIETQKKENQQKLSVAIGAILLLALLLALGLWNRNRYIKKTSAALALAKDRAQLSEKYKEQFLANMSHEIRTPMHAISGMVKILERNEHPPTQDVFLNAMQTSSENLVVILNDVLDLSKIEAGKLDIESIPIKPAAVMQNVTQILRYKAEEKGLGLTYKIADDVPSLVMGDPTRLNQILVNLVGNAIKFTEKGSVAISLSKVEDRLIFSIKDTGIGISKDKMESIFEAFEQVKDSTSRNYRGTGLGLSISRQLVELQHGKIWAESEEGQGSTFYVELPIVAAAADAIGQDLITADRFKTMAASLKGIRILLAEDNAFNQMIAKDDLSFYIEEVKIDVVKNGVLAVEKFKAEDYDLILMDVQMPEMNGFKATKKIREIECTEGVKTATPIIAMTASLLKTEIDNCYGAGMDNYIPKPYKAEELIGAIYKELREISVLM